MNMDEMTRDQAVGCFLGHCIGDALGAFLEFQDAREPDNYITTYQSGGPHRLKAGQWTDDSSMALGLANHLIGNHGILRAEDVMSNWLNWYFLGEFSSTGKCFDIGSTCEKAIRRYQSGMHPDDCGETGEYASGNGALMRLHPCVIAASSVEEAVTNSLYQTRLTHNNPEVLLYSEAFSKELWYGQAMPEYSHLKLPKETPRNKVLSGGYVKETYQCAWWAVENTSSFEEAVIVAVNRGHDADTSGAITGALAGRIYGEGSIPDHLYNDLYSVDILRKTAVALYNLREVNKK